MLLPFLLRQHKVWSGCVLRIFTVAQMEDNSIQMKKDLEVFLYHLRIQAQVQVVELTESDVSAYAYGRTIMMEQRSQMLRDLNLSKKEKEVVLPMVRRPSLAPEQRAESAPPSSQNAEEEKAKSMADFGSMTDLTNQKSRLHTHEEVDENTEDILYSSEGAGGVSNGPSSSMAGNGALQVNNETQNLYTFSPSDLKSDMDKMKGLLHLKPEKRNVRRMHTAVRINEVIVERSHDAKLILINLPGPPKKEAGYENYMEYLEVLTEGLDRTVLVRGSGREVITIFS